MTDPYECHKVLEVKALDDYKLYLKFDTNEEKIYDMKSEIDEVKFFKKLKNKDYFKKVAVRGNTVEWEDGEDVAPENLYQDSVKM